MYPIIKQGMYCHNIMKGFLRYWYKNGILVAGILPIKGITKLISGKLNNTLGYAAQTVIHGHKYSSIYDKRIFKILL